MKTWLEKEQYRRGKRALERQLEYQEKKSKELVKNDDEFLLNIFARARAIRQKLEAIQPIPASARVLEVGSGAHGLIFGFGGGLGVGIDPLAVDYKRLFPKWQEDANTVAAIGEQLPFPDESFDVVLSDNVIDHAEKPLKIVEELVRVLKKDGLLYFTVNIHHPIYNLASKLHGAWNALGIKFELSPFADHTVHFTEDRMKQFFAQLPLEIREQNSTVEQTKAAYKQIKSPSPEQRLKKIFFKNALFEIVAIKK
jgi:ubiquinone/menaquinone biosynthesis C-methylase UbiE